LVQKEIQQLPSAQEEGQGLVKYALILVPVAVAALLHC
jgi:hypothetical protein